MKGSLQVWTGVYYVHKTIPHPGLLVSYEEIEDFDGDSEELENDEDYTEMDEAKDALITESENLELGRLKEEY